MRKICVFNIKGGVGKTTTSVNLAAGLARKGKKVLLMDMDAQASVSNCLEADNANKNMYHLIANGAELAECITHMGKDLDLVASSESLNDIDAELANNVNRHNILSAKMENNNGYDYIIFDCPPHFGTMTKNALSYSDEVFIPVSTDVLGQEGLKKTIDLISKIDRKKAKAIKVIPTFFDKRLKISKSILEDIRNDFYEKVTEPIRANSKLKEAPKQKKSIFAYAKSSPGAKDYERLLETTINDEKVSSKRQAEPLKVECSA